MSTCPSNAKGLGQGAESGTEPLCFYTLKGKRETESYLLSLKSLCERSNFFETQSIVISRDVDFPSAVFKFAVMSSRQI